MSNASLKDFEIVGFNGTASGYCGRAFCLVKKKGTENYYKFTTEKQLISSVSLSLEDIELYRDEGRLTLIEEEIPAFPDAMILYVTHQFLESISFNLQSFVHQSEYFFRQKLGTDVELICTSYSLVESLMNSWAMCFVEKITCDLVKLVSEEFEENRDVVYSEANRQYAEYLKTLEDYIWMGLYAARHPAIRARLYIRYGYILVQSYILERLDNLFHTSIVMEFPAWTWEGFQNRIKIFQDILEFKASLEQTDEYVLSQEESSNIILHKNIDREVEEIAKKLLTSFDLELTVQELDVLMSADGEGFLKKDSFKRFIANNRLYYRIKPMVYLNLAERGRIVGEPSSMIEKQLLVLLKQQNNRSSGFRLSTGSVAVD